VTDVPFSGDYDGSLAAILESLRETAELEGLAILDLTEADSVSCFIGIAGQDTVAIGHDLLVANPILLAHAVASDKRPILACPWVLPPSRSGGLAGQSHLEFA
jgi:hypothetical protein